jgi:DNA-binding transcriptional ArsR family regulator
MLRPHQRDPAQLARELQQSPASVNEHLAVLRNAGLLTSRRSGRSVLYRQTPLAEYIVNAQQDTEGHHSVVLQRVHIQRAMGIP